MRDFPFPFPLLSLFLALLLAEPGSSGSPGLPLLMPYVKEPIQCVVPTYGPFLLKLLQACVLPIPVPSCCIPSLQGKEMLTQKLPLWQQSCSDPNKIPDRAIQLMQQMAASSNGTIMPSPLSTSKSNLIISDPIPGAKPLPVPPELAPFVGVSILVVEVVLPF